MDCEYIMQIAPLDVVPENHVIASLPYDIRLDTAYGSTVHGLPNDLSPASISWPTIFIRRGFREPDAAFYPLCQLDPIAGELEVATYGRRQLEEKLASDLPVRCVHTTIFNDRFGLYRHMHKAIEGVYIFMANMKHQEANSQTNVLPLTLGPHGCNLKDVVKAIRPYWQTLEEGLNMTIKGEKIIVFVFNIAYRADMPQKQDNAGMLRQGAAYGCRDCNISKYEQGHLRSEWALPPNRRAHYELQRQRRRLEGKGTLSAKSAYGASIGMALERAPLEMWSPALDIVRSRPGDAAHSEFAGITRMTHTILPEQVCIISILFLPSLPLRYFDWEC